MNEGGKNPPQGNGSKGGNGNRSPGGHGSQKGREGDAGQGGHASQGGQAGRAATADPPGGAGATTEGIRVGVGLASDSVSVVHSFFEYISARLNLEGYRFERRGRTLIAYLCVLLVAVGIALLGIVLLSLGAVGVIAQLTDSRAAGLLIVGGAEVLIGGILAWSARQKASGGREG